MHEVQRLISTGLRDVHNWIKDERMILSVHDFFFFFASNILQNIAAYKQNLSVEITTE